MENQKKLGASAFLPLIVFLVLYVGCGITFTLLGVESPFGQFPRHVALLAGIAVALLLAPKVKVSEKLDVFCQNMGNSGVMMIILIYLMAGGFQGAAAAMGGKSSVINLALHFIPVSLLVPGVFLMCCFISTAIGTSMGTIAAITPIAVGVAEKANLNMVMLLGAVVGGAMFGDNLSFISDTTIAAARGQNVEMKDKFRLNFLIALPAAIITLVLLCILGRPDTALDMGELSYSLVKVIPYVVVLALALIGMDVMLVMALGIASAALVGVATGSITIIQFAEAVWAGVIDMDQSFYLALLIGGMTAIIKEQGGLEWLVQKLQKVMKSNKSAQFGIAGLVGVLDAATTNNTVAIIIANPIAKDVSRDYDIDPRRTASLLDLWSCVVQGILPHGGQTLLACTLAATYGLSITPVDIIPYLWYPMLLGVFAVISVFVPFADSACCKDPWNWEYDCPESKVAEKKANMAAAGQ